MTPLDARNGRAERIPARFLDPIPPIELCPRCRLNPAAPRHTCPYEQEINGNDDENYCRCCPDCERECVNDI